LSDSQAVAFKNVSKSFGDRKVLDEVSFDVAEGEAVCILGRSGTGKSVTLKLMIGLLKPDSGEVCIDSEDITHFEENDLSRVRRKIGYLFQSAALFDSFSLEDNLALPYRHFNKGSSKAEISKVVTETLRSVGLEKDLKKMSVELSGGMRKRAGLARALVLGPKILLVDEPSSGLDRITAGEIDKLLLQVKQERHTTLVIVTHDVRGARRVADKIVVLDKGKIVGMGTVADLESSDNEVVRELISES
jgi:phospholipid/cholesterol/gamma-HCH transport system ATP-binding protein